jgi:hypothetical protein
MDFKITELNQLVAIKSLKDTSVQTRMCMIKLLGAIKESNIVKSKYYTIDI